MVDARSNLPALASIHSIAIASLQQFIDRQISTHQLVKLAEQFQWELLEGQYASDQSPEAQTLRHTLSDIVAQWECRPVDSREEFPPEWTQDWITQLRSIPMTDTHKNQPIFHITHQNGNINTGDITVQGHMIGTQNNITAPDLDGWAEDYRAFILYIQQKYRSITDESTIVQLIDVEAKLLQSQDKRRWQNFLSLRRLQNGIRKAALKIGEHFAEENPWYKGAIAFLEGVGEDATE